MAALEIEQFPCLSDNYGFLLHDPDAGLTAAIDTPDAGEIERQLERRGWRLTHIFNTHHHGDHAGGNLALKQRFACEIVGPRADAARIPGIDVQVGDGDTVAFGDRRIEVYDTPGHTRGHIVYYVPEAAAAFVGDTLFAMGCGRLFEGSPEQMWNSLSKIARWPDATWLYC
ncbi:MAG: hydroxyacylglutathione hydrolase, partial [Gammaproteobacteria bacterium]|nr:hydroxyacylglutathione hydrolase [Gammaproteobacteria bacterium]